MAGEKLLGAIIVLGACLFGFRAYQTAADFRSDSSYKQAVVEDVQNVWVTVQYQDDDDKLKTAKLKFSAAQNLARPMKGDTLNVLINTQSGEVRKASFVSLYFDTILAAAISLIGWVFLLRKTSK
jgi:hypothetical protein